MRTANPNSRAVASEISGGAPPYQYSPRKDPDLLIRRSVYVAHLDFSPSPALLYFTKIHRISLANNKRFTCLLSKHALNQNSPPGDWTGCQAHALRTWPNTTCCDGQCQGPQAAPPKGLPTYRAWTMQPFMLTWYERDTRGLSHHSSAEAEAAGR